MPTFFVDLHSGDLLRRITKAKVPNDEAVYEQAVLAMVDLAKGQLCSEGELKLIARAHDSAGATVFTTVLSVTSKLTRVVPAVRCS
jgi:hypothetical protein